MTILQKCDRVCIKGPLVGRYEPEISAVKVNWLILVGFREILQSGSLLHRCHKSISGNVVVPYFGRIRILVASYYRCCQMALRCRNILEYWTLAARYCFKYVF